MKIIMIQRFCFMTEKHDMLSLQQMRAQQSRFSKTAIIWLLSQIWTVWKNENSVATLLSLNMSGIFPRMLHKRLAHIMRRKKVFTWLMNWTFFFMINKKIILIFDNQKSEVLQISVKVSQDLSLFLIFFLFYNVKLLEICNSIRKKISNVEFINDINMLAYKRFTKNNCR